MVGSFYLHLLSNTKGNKDNKTSKFTVRLPRKLEFNSPWRVGLMSIIYPYSWSNIGTDDAQHIDVRWKNGMITRIRIPSSEYRTVESLKEQVNGAIRDWSKNLCVIREADPPQEDGPEPKRAKRNNALLEQYRKALERSVGDPTIPAEQFLTENPDQWVGHKLLKALRSLTAAQQLMKTHKESLETLNGRITELTTQVNNNAAAKRRLEKEKEELAAERDQLATDKTVLKKEKEDTEHLLQTKQAVFDEYQRKTQASLDANAAQKQVTEGERKRKDEEIARLNERHRIQKTQIEQKDDQIQRITARIVQLNKSIEQYRVKEQELERLRTEHATLTTERDNLRAEVEELKSEKTVNERTVSELRDTVAARERELRESVASKTSELREKVSTFERDSAAALAAAESAKRVEIEKILRKSREDLSTHEQSVANLNATIDALNTRIRDLERRPPPSVVEPVHANEEPRETLSSNEVCIEPKGSQHTAYFSQLSDWLKLDMENNTDRLVCKMRDDVIESVQISAQLQYVLGFDKPVLRGSRIVAKYTPDPHGGIHSIFIYAPGLVEPTIVGDDSVALLRIAKVKGKPGDMVEDTFLSPLYHKVMEKSITDISIEIRTSTERLVPFNWGDCILVLHFQKEPFF